MLVSMNKWDLNSDRLTRTLFNVREYYESRIMFNCARLRKPSVVLERNRRCAYQSFWRLDAYLDNSKHLLLATRVQWPLRFLVDLMDRDLLETWYAFFLTLVILLAVLNKQNVAVFMMSLKKMFSEQNKNSFYRLYRIPSNFAINLAGNNDIKKTIPFSNELIECCLLFYCDSMEKETRRAQLAKKLTIKTYSRKTAHITSKRVQRKQSRLIFLTNIVKIIL